MCRRVLLASLVASLLLPLRVYAEAGGLDTRRPPVDQTIHYRARNARAVTLVWGVNGWHLVPPERRPAGTTERDAVLRTPMELRDGVFATTLRVPGGTLVDYGFLVTVDENDASLTTWDGDYVATAVGAVRDRHTPRRDARVRGGWLALGSSAACFVLGLVVGASRRRAAPGDEAGPRTIDLDLPVSGRAAAAVLGVGALGSAALVVATAPAVQSWGMGGAARLLWQELNLLDENVIASWYSAMLLLAVAVAACLCAVRDAANHRNRLGRLVAGGWVAIAAIFAVLSFDEMAALHERLGKISDFAVLVLRVVGGPGGAPADGVDLFSVRPALRYVSLAFPIAAVGCFLVIFGWVRVRRVPGALALLILGTALFLCIPFYEHVEQHALRPLPGSAIDWEAFDRTIWLEEVTEILGMLAFLAATLTYLVATPRRHPPWRVDLHTAARVQAAALAVLGLAFVATAAARRILPVDDDGIAEHWFPSVLAALVAFGSALLWARRPLGAPRRALDLASAVFHVLVSLYFGADAHGFLHQPSAAPLGGWVHAGLALAAGGLGVRLALGAPDTWSRTASLGWAVLLGAAFVGGGGTAPVLAFLAYGLLAMALLAPAADASLATA